MRLYLLYIFVLVFGMSSCKEKTQVESTPWGTTIGEESDLADTISAFSVSEIQTNGELIMLTMTGADTYFDYHGHGMGTQYLLCEKFAQHLGVSLRVEVCKDTLEMTQRLKNGEGDIIVFQLPKTTQGVRFCGYTETQTSWAVSLANKDLASTLNNWYKPEFMDNIRKEEKFLLSAQSVRRKTYAPMLNASAGIISRYDHLFQRYAPAIRWDWRLMAAQCYQESTFDPQARSWAGACGLMQIMPSTANEIGLPLSDIYNPEKNIAAAAHYIEKLNRMFNDIPNSTERQWFVLASYNGGHFHIRDAMALTQKYGGNPHRWSDVSHYVLKLSTPQYYRDNVVKYGYMRGEETADYVARIRDRWMKYRGLASIGSTSSFEYKGDHTPQKARHKNRFKL